MWGIVVGLTTANATLVALSDSLGIHVAFTKMGLTCAKAPAFAQAIATDVKITRRIVWIANRAITINLAPISALSVECNIESGACSYGCQNGFYGEKCTLKCSPLYKPAFVIEIQVGVYLVV